MAESILASNKEIMTRARESLRNNWKVPVIVTLVYLVIAAMSGQSEALNLAFSLILGGPIALGFAFFYLGGVRQQRFDSAVFGQAFQQFLNAMLTYILVGLLVVLWSLLLIIPGILAALSYSLTFYVMHDEPQLHTLQAIRRSKELMYGHRWQLFCLGFRFLGWSLLALLTLGIGFLWLLPYFQTAMAHFYEEVLNSQGLVQPELIAE